MDSGYNEVKFLILDTLRDLTEATVQEVATELERSHCSVSMAMLRYHRMGLLSRYSIERNTKVYSLTSRGYERLDWLAHAFI